MTGQVTALGLFSGGLDSILACRVVADLGVRVIALKFVTPFFDHDLLARPQEYTREMGHKYGLEVALVDLSEGYLDMLDRPAHGFGKHFNPCIDCKILMLTRARQLARRAQADRHAFATRTAGAADPVHVGVGVAGHVVVDDQSQVLDV